MRHKRPISAFVVACVVFRLMVEAQELTNGEGIEFNEEDINAIVEFHNQLRAQNITPPASNMREVTWDANLAKFSEEWTTNCEYGSKENTTTELWSSAGQSFFLATAAWHINFHYSAIMKWLGQKSLFTYQNGSCSDFCDHYRQLAFADTYKVGCAAAFCPTVTSPGSDNKIANATYYMCAYYPAAPLEGEYQPYEKGPACTNCTDPTDACADRSLCANAQRAKPLEKPQEGSPSVNNGCSPADTTTKSLEKPQEGSPSVNNGCSPADTTTKLREKPQEELPTVNNSWSTGTGDTMIAVGGVMSAAVLSAMVAFVVKMNKGRSIGPSSPSSPAEEIVAEEQNVGNGKAPTNPLEGGES